MRPNTQKKPTKMATKKEKKREKAEEVVEGRHVTPEGQKFSLDQRRNRIGLQPTPKWLAERHKQKIC